MVFVGARESSSEALFLQRPRLQCSCGVLTAESPHNAQAHRFFRLCRQNVRANTLLQCTLSLQGPIHQLWDRHVEKGRKEVGWYLCVLVRRQ